MAQEIFESVYEWLLNLNSTDVIAALALIVSTISLFSNYKTNKRSNEFSKKANDLTSLVNSAEFELYKKLKYDTLSMLAKLKSLDALAEFSPNITGGIDYSREINIIKELQTSPLYPLLLYSIKDYEKRLRLETNLRILTTSKLSNDDVRGWIHLIVKTIENDLDFKKFTNMDFMTLVKELCTMKCIFTTFNLEEWEKRNRSKGYEFQMFTNYLIEICKVKDPDVIFYNAGLRGDTTIVEKAIGEGAKRDVTADQIIIRYKREYENFMAQEVRTL